MPIRFKLPTKFTRDQIEWRMDELAIRFPHDKKNLARIAALSRLLARMKYRTGDRENRQQHSTVNVGNYIKQRMSGGGLRTSGLKFQPVLSP